MSPSPAIGLIACLLLAACNASSFGGDSSPSKKEEDGRRPSEQGEGLVGYLRDPNEVQLRRSEGNVIVSAPKNAVVVDNGAVEGLPICVQQVSPDVLRNLLETGSSFGGLQIAILGRTTAAADGSFAVTVAESALDPKQLFSVNVTGQCDAAESASTLDASRNSIVFRDLASDQPFGRAGVFYPEFDVPAPALPDDPAAFVPQDVFCGEDNVGNYSGTANACDTLVGFTLTQRGSGAAITESLTLRIIHSPICFDDDPCSPSGEVGSVPLAPSTKIWLKLGEEYTLEFVRGNGIVQSFPYKGGISETLSFQLD